MTRVVARWTDWSGHGLEHLVLTEDAGVITAEAVAISGDEAAFAVRYRIVCNARWHVRQADIAVIGDDRGVSLRADGDGRWTDGDGTPLGQLDGAIDIDLAVTPFTNTLPLRRLGLAPGQAANVAVAYVAFPDLSLTLDAQRYTCLDAGRRYLFQSLDSDFEREIEVDDHGLVTTYPGLFRRLL